MLNEIKISAWSFYAGILHIMAIFGGFVMYKFITNPVDLAKGVLKLAATPIWPW